MAEIDKKDVVAYQIVNKLYCVDCLENKEVSLEDIFTKDDLDPDILYFCDECGRQL